LGKNHVKTYPIRYFSIVTQTTEYSTSSLSQDSSITNNLSLNNSNDITGIRGSNNPSITANYIVGFTDGEGNFTIIIFIMGSIRVIFRIGQHKVSESLLYKIQEYFQCGYVISGGSSGTMRMYQVTRIKDIVHIIIPFFDAHPLLSSKILNYNDFRTVAFIIYKKEHLTEQGYAIVKEIASHMNTKRNYQKEFRQDVIKVLTNEWVRGFIEGEGSFSIGVSAKTTIKLGYQVSAYFSVGLHIRDLHLLYSLKHFFGNNGYVVKHSKDGTIIRYEIKSISQIANVVIPFFDEHSLLTFKMLNYSDFRTVVKIMQTKAHLTIEGLNEINRIKFQINIRNKTISP